MTPWRSLAEARLAADYLERAAIWATDTDPEIVNQIELARERLVRHINEAHSITPVDRPACIVARWPRVG